jgi:hypothetical protein
MALVLGVAAVVLLVLSAVVGPAPASVWLRLVVVFAQWAGPLLLVASLAVLLRRSLTAWVRRLLIDLAGPALISAMPPRTVFNTVLARVFGEKVGYQEVATALLGGSGRDPAARDTAVSKDTVAHVRFERVDERKCLTEITWSHEFSGVRNNHHYVLFATTDADILTLVNSERVHPLFEIWRVEDEDKLADFVPGLKDQLDVGVTYRDGDGRVHVVEPRPVVGEEVALGDYGRFIRMPRTVDAQNLVIFHLDLHDLSDPDHVVDSIERMTLRISTVGSFDQGYLSWSAPYPCFVTKIVFDVRQLAWRNEELVYQVIASTLKLTDIPLRGTWTREPERVEIVVDSWMLPGHAVTLLWRPVTETESRHGLDRW